MTTTNTLWDYGPAEPFWMEENPPTCNCWSYYFEAGDVADGTRSLLYLLHQLQVLGFGSVYETVEKVRIKDVRRY